MIGYYLGRPARMWIEATTPRRPAPAPRPEWRALPRPGGARRHAPPSRDRLDGTAA
jgi:hypothetical protein